MTGAEAIHDRESLKHWLRKRPGELIRATAVVMASRNALRSLPSLQHTEGLTPGESATLAKLTLWRSIMARSVRTWPDRAITTAGTAYAAFYAAYPPAVVGAAAYAASAANDTYAASAASYASSVYAFVGVTLTTVNAAVIATDAAAARYADYTHQADDASFWKQVRLDAVMCEGTEDVFTLYSMPVWNDALDWWEKEARAFRTFLTSIEMREGQWDIWVEWFDSVVIGQPAFALKSWDTAHALERAIALGGKDSEFHKEFWEREPGEINAEIAEWVTEARAAEAVQERQGDGLRFQIANGKIELGRFHGLKGPEDDRQRIEKNLPRLAELASLLKAELDGREAPYPPLLLKVLARFSMLVNGKPETIEPDDLYAASTLLRGQTDNASRASPNSNAPPLEGGELALAKSITLFSDLVVLGTSRGKALFDDADRAAVDAGKDDAFIAVSKQLFELVKLSGDVMNGDAVDLLLEVLTDGHLSPHPNRFAFFQEGSAKNALTVFGAFALLAVISGTSIGWGAAALLADKLIDVGIMVGGAYALSAEARKAINEFAFKNEKLLKDIAKRKQSLKWLEDLLFLIEKRRKKDSRKE